MRVIIAGSRTITDYGVVCRAMENSGFVPTEVVSGGARGVDRLGARWARLHGVPVKMFHAKWDKHGRKAGFIRNEEMANYAVENDIGGLVAVWDGVSRGTEHMITTATQYCLLIHVERVDDQA